MVNGIRSEINGQPTVSMQPANDVLRLSQLLAPETRIPVVERIAQDLNRFLDAIEADRSIDPKSLKINSSVGEIVERIARAYGLSRSREA